MRVSSLTADGWVATADCGVRHFHNRIRDELFLPVLINVIFSARLSALRLLHTPI